MQGGGFAASVVIRLQLSLGVRAQPECRVIVSIVVVVVVVAGYVALTFPTRRRRDEWEQVKKDPNGPWIEIDQTLP